MRFKPGQQVVCIKKDHWIWCDDKTPMLYGPKFNEVVTIEYYNDNTSVALFEYNRTYHGFRPAFYESWFMPLMDISELTEILNALKYETRESNFLR